MDRDEWDRRYAGREFVWDTGPNRFVAGELSALPPGLALDLVVVTYLHLLPAERAEVLRRAAGSLRRMAPRSRSATTWTTSRTAPGARRIPPFSTPRRPSPPNCPG